jgi:hypothetical protein
MDNTYYKAVYVQDDGRLLSAIVSNNFPSLRLNYALNVWTEATVGGILVFSSLMSALDLVGGTRYRATYHIYECEVEQPIPLPAQALFANCLYMETVADLWKNMHVNAVLKTHWPKDTASFKRVKLTKLVPTTEYDYEKETISSSDTVPVV